jgi:phosphotriesterase-related protein
MFFLMRAPGGPFGAGEVMDDLFVQDIEEGITGTNVRAGIIKCATNVAGVTPAIERVLQACARAHRRTGVPITTHTFHIPNGLEQQRVFAEAGVDLGRVVIGHIEAAAAQDLGYVEEVINNGSFVGFDRFGLQSYSVNDGEIRPTDPDASDRERMDCIAALCERGYADRLVLSHDHMCYCDMVPEDWMTGQTLPDWKLYTIPDKVLPGLRDRGVGDDQIELMTRVNPRRVFETAAGGAY